MVNRYNPLYLRVSEKGKPLSDSLKQAFADEIRLNDYLKYVLVTAAISAILLAVRATWHNGEFVLYNLVPLDGQWHPRDGFGNLYVETWCTIFINACQIGFGVWGAILLLHGVRRVLASHKYFFGCFSLGITFCGFAWYLPAMSQPIFQMLVDRLPFLIN